MIKEIEHDILVSKINSIQLQKKLDNFVAEKSKSGPEPNKENSLTYRFAYDAIKKCEYSVKEDTSHLLNINPNYKPITNEDLRELTYKKIKCDDAALTMRNKIDKYITIMEYSIFIAVVAVSYILIID